MNPHPFSFAIALSEQRFDSGRVAISRGQAVILEFYPSMVCVHDPLQKSPSHSETLGIILYSYNFPYFRNPELSVESAQQDGIVRKDGPGGFVQFHHIKLISRGSHTECTFCGKVWNEKHSKPIVDAQMSHLNAHLTKEGILL